MQRVIFILLLSFFSNTALAQSKLPILERKVTIKVTNIKLSNALNIIAESADFYFSYTNSILNGNEIVSIYADNRTVQEVLNQLFNNQIKYQQIGNHLILQKKKMPTNPIANKGNKQNTYKFYISGYIRDIESGEALTQVSIFETSNMNTAISGDFGYYSFQMVSKLNKIKLRIAAENYRDTLIDVNYDNGGDIELNINLQSLLKVVPIEPGNTDSTRLINFNDSIFSNNNDTLTITKGRIGVQDTRVGKWLISNYQKALEKNIRDSFYRKWQCTFVPPLGTNKKLSGLVTNALSVNVLAGYNGGLNGVEFGGLCNILKNNMRGVQFAGVTNVVGKNVEGAQFAGISNQNLGDVVGTQFAGVCNYNHHSSEGAQFAGVINFNRGVNSGFQAAGVGNFTNGASNTVQVAGVLNVANRITGGQIAGVLNVARYVKGFQLGLINVADSAFGASFGIINFVKNGIHQLEIGANDYGMFNVGYRSGTGKVYSVISLASEMPFYGKKSMMCYGYALGTQFKLFKNTALNFSLGSNQFGRRFNSDNLQLLNQLKSDIEYKVVKGVSIFVGTTLNHLLVDKFSPDYNDYFKSLVAKPIWEYGDRFKQTAWVGYQFGIRLF